MTMTHDQEGRIDSNLRVIKTGEPGRESGDDSKSTRSDALRNRAHIGSRHCAIFRNVCSTNRVARTPRPKTRSVARFALSRRRKRCHALERIHHRHVLRPSEVEAETAFKPSLGGPESIRAHAIVDQAGWHFSIALEVPPKFTPMPLPAKSPELNPVENIWRFMRDKWISNRIFKSNADILDHC